MRPALLTLLVSAVSLAQPAAIDLSSALPGEQVLDSVRHGDLVYAAVSSGGVAIVDVSQPSHPVLVRRIAEGRPVSKLLLSGETLYLVELRPELLPYSLATPKEPKPAYASVLPTQAAPPGTGVAQAFQAPVTSAVPEVAPPSAPNRVKVLDVEKGRAIFAGGAEEGFTPGSKIRVISQQIVEKPDLVNGGVKKVPSNEVTAVLRIEQAEAHRAMAELGRGDRVHPGDLVESTNEPLSERLFLPRQATFTSRTGFHARPFLGLGSNSYPVGVLADVYYAYYVPDLPIALQAGLAPAGLAVGTSTSHYPTILAATGAYATDFFEIGLGVGTAVGQCPPADTTCPKVPIFTINQLLRLGSLDGLNVSWQSSIFTGRGGFSFGSGRGEINLPLTTRLGLFAGGGGGANGFGFGEFGVRTYVGGAGARGTLIYSASLGYAGLFDGGSGIGGPSVAFGMEWRL